MTASRILARRQKLRVRDVGFVDGRAMIARSNWDILEVRGIDGALRMRHEIALDGEYLLHDVRFAGRYLVVEIGGGVVACGCRVWDLLEARWVSATVDHWDDTSLVGIDAARGRAALSDGKGVDIVAVASGEIERRFPLLSPSTVAFHPTRADAVIAADEEALFLVAGDQIVRTLPAADARVAWLDTDRIVVARAGRIELLDEELSLLRVVGTIAATALAVIDARWLVAGGEGTTTLLDVDDRVPPRTLEGVAAMQGNRVAWATDDTEGETSV